LSLFADNKRRRVQSIVLKIVNNRCLKQSAFPDDQREDKRVNLTLPVAVLPLENDRICLDRAFTALTKEFSSTGLSLAIDGLVQLDEVILGFSVEGEMVYLKAKLRHIEPMGGGFHQAGFMLTEATGISDYPDLRGISL
jgi:hypothetical protein